MDINTPDSNPTSSSSYLAYLPHDILLVICSHLDRRSTWRSMWVWGSLRAAAMKALRVHLEELVLTANPPRLNSLYEPMRAECTETRREEFGDICAISEKARRRLEGYPPAAELLRSLTIELWSDSDNAGFDILAQHSSQLERLEIHMVDQFEAESIVYEEDEQGNPVYNDGWMCMAYTWPPVFQLPPRSLRYLSLTHLTIAATARIIGHFAHLAECVPNIVRLALSCHRRDILDPNYDPTDDIPIFDLFPSLEALTVSGDGCTVASLLASLSESIPHIHYLIIHVPTPDYPHTTICEVIGITIIDGVKLRGLALYGGLVVKILGVMKRCQVRAAEIHGEGTAASGGDASAENLGPIGTFPHLKSLALEGSPRCWPIQYQDPTDWVDFPILDRILWTAPHIENGIYTLGLNGFDEADYASAERMRQVSSHYQVLRVTLWYAGYPTKPFRNVLPQNTDGKRLRYRKSQPGVAGIKYLLWQATPEVQSPSAAWARTAW